MSVIISRCSWITDGGLKSLRIVSFNSGMLSIIENIACLIFSKRLAVSS